MGWMNPLRIWRWLGIRRAASNQSVKFRVFSLEFLEDRTLPSTLFDVIDPKASGSFNTQQLTVQDLFDAQASGALRVLWSGAYDTAKTAGPLPNQLTGPGATLLDAHRNYNSEWQASESTLTSEIPATNELDLKGLGDVTLGAFKSTISSPTVQFAVGMAAVCWIVDPFSAEALTPWCADLSIQAAETFATEYSENFIFEVGHQAINDLPLSQTTKDRANALLTITQVGIDLNQYRTDLLDDQRFLNAPDILERLYHNAHATAGFIGWVDGLRDQATDLFRASDQATAGITAATMTSSAIQFQARRIGDAVLDITSQRPLTSAEQKSVRTLFTDTNFSTAFLGAFPESGAAPVS